MTLLKRAAALDSAKKYSEALICYQEGIQLLMKVLKGENTNSCLELLKKSLLILPLETSDEEKRKTIRERLQRYMTRAETVKDYAKAIKMGKLNLLSEQLCYLISTRLIISTLKCFLHTQALIYM